MSQPPNIMLPTLAALASVIVFSTSGLCIKALPLEALTISFSRSFFAVIFFTLLLFRRGSLRDVLRLKPMGWVVAVAYLLTLTSFCIAMKLTTAANTIFLQYTMPAWVLIGGAVWLKEKITVGRVVSVLLCLAGMLLFFQGELQPQDRWGNLTALFSGLCFAVLTLCLRVERDQNPLAAILAGNGLVVITNVPLVMVFFPDQFIYLVQSDLSAWMALIWLGFIQIGVAYILFTYALRRLPAIEVSILSLLEPVLNPLWVFLALGETPSRHALAGGGIILFSVLIRTLTLAKPHEVKGSLRKC